MSFDIWKTLYSNNFNSEKYLYHYTDFETAIKIICSNNLLFSSITKTNDTTESKLKIDFEYKDTYEIDIYKNMVSEITKYFNENFEIVQLLCFSMDLKIAEKDRKKYVAALDAKNKFYDVSGRGFALPRMWAQYAKKNEGVCFIFNKDKLIQQVKKRIAFSKCKKVTYNSFSKKHLISVERMEALYNKISLVSNGTLTLLDMIQKDKDFLDYNFFEKLDDWKNENEYRIIALIDNKNKQDYRMPINGMLSFLEGIVIGEKMDQAYENTIKLLVDSKDKKCEVKRIQFDSHICKII